MMGRSRQDNTAVPPEELNAVVNLLLGAMKSWSFCEEFGRAAEFFSPKALDLLEVLWSHIRDPSAGTRRKCRMMTIIQSAMAARKLPANTKCRDCLLYTSD